MKLEDFDYDLPRELIAQVPARERTASRLLHLDGASGALEDLTFPDIVALVQPDDTIVVNDTRVIKARLTGTKSTGGAVEVLVERVISHDEVLAQVRASHAPRSGARLVLAGRFEATVVERDGQFARVRFERCSDVLALLDAHGAVPLPPYIERTPEATDEARYQTVYANEPGAVAAPTAGLHFDDSILEALRARRVTIARVTLHVGAGTFQPVRTSDLSGHAMHSEWYRVPQETVDAIHRTHERGGRVLAAGTTTLRALESAAAEGLRERSGETTLFIVPGYRFRIVERLLTNLHLPKSTLLMLVSAFGGAGNVRRAYAHAIDHRYRFYSYGDAMLIEGAQRIAHKASA